MNTRIVQHDIPRLPRTPHNTNFAGGRGDGSSPTLGTRTLIDDLVSRDNSSMEACHQGPSSIRRIPVTPRLEASVSTVEKTVGATTPFGVPVEENPGDRGSSVGVGGPEEVYGINGEEVSKEDYL